MRLSFPGAGSNPISCVAWSPDRAVFASVFAALSAVAAFNAVAPRPGGESARPRIGQGEAAVTDGHKHPAQANHHIAQAEKHIAQQKKLIDQLERDGARDIDVAVSMLRAPPRRWSPVGTTKTRRALNIVRQIDSPLETCRSVEPRRLNHEAMQD
jgi:hypothetical protein